MIRRTIRTFLLAVLGGCAIGIGGILFLSIDNKIIGALLFTVGLYTICLHGLNLFTGKVGYLPSQPPSFLLELVIIWAGNLLGTALSAQGMLATRLAFLGEKAALLCTPKLSDSMVSLFILGIFCGALMFIAVDGYKATQNPVVLFIGVSAFILCGFEHCIADMFYLSAAKMWSGSALIRIAVITLGNSVGGLLIPLIKKLTAPKQS